MSAVRSRSKGFTETELLDVARRVHAAYCGCGGMGTSDYEFAADRLTEVEARVVAHDSEGADE